MEQIPIKPADAAETIPQGQTREDIEQREKLIKNFYANWNAVNPTKHIFNIALNDFIHVRFLSIQETAEHAAFTYKSTLAVTYLTEILEKVTVEKRVKPKPNNQNQKTVFRNDYHAIQQKSIRENQTDSGRAEKQSEKHSILYHSHTKND